MNLGISSEHLVEALTRAHQHWQGRHQGEAENATRIGRPAPSSFTIALSREAGTYGAAIAREVGNRLGWPVYDRELLQRIADDMHVHRTLVESVDERHVNWLSECLEGFSMASVPNQSAYLHRLVQAVLSLAAHGDCVIVGRGATKVLPLATTLRVRVIAPFAHRVEAVGREHGIAVKEAARKVKETDRERDRFVQEHFMMDPADPSNYDLVLNVARFSLEECADLILAALDRLRKHPATKATPHAAGAVSPHAADAM